jgi:hypothetical protein
MTDDRVLPPPPPPSSSALLGRPSSETDFWAGLFVDLSVRIEWLEQALDAVPHVDASTTAATRLRSYARALEELHKSLGRVQAYRADARLKPLFSLEGPLAAYLSRLYAWCEQISDDFERMASALRRREPTSLVFAHRSVNSSYAHFEALVASMREAIDVARELHGDRDAAAWGPFDTHIEELVWSTEWLHMTLARRPGE